jgi:hypothetical protein
VKRPQRAIRAIGVGVVLSARRLVPAEQPCEAAEWRAGRWSLNVATGSQNAVPAIAQLGGAGVGIDSGRPLAIATEGLETVRIEIEPCDFVRRSRSLPVA